MELLYVLDCKGSQMTEVQPEPLAASERDH